MIMTLEELKNYAKIDYDDEDDVLMTLIEESQAAAEDYCRVSFDGYAPLPVVTACRLWILHYHENRENPDQVAYRAMRRAWESLLYPYRAPELMF